MPEGDTIYRTAVQLRKALLGKRVTGFQTQLTQVEARVRDHPILGREVSRVEPRGKHLLIYFAVPAPEGEPAGAAPTAGADQTLVLHSHMRMTGSWHLYRPRERWQKPERFARVVVRTSDFVAVCFHAPVVSMLTEREVERHPDLKSLGPDAIAEEFDPEEARLRLLRDPELPIGVALMRQQLLAGVGNVFKSEILFIQRLSPFVPVGDLPEGVLEAVISEAQRLLVLNRERGSRQTRFTLNEKDRLWVYGRSGEACRVCGTVIRMRRQGEDARSTYYCPQCQEAPTFGAAKGPAVHKSPCG